MTKDQELAKYIILHTNKSLFITGKAGTGKSHFLRAVLSKSTKKSVVLAPTGIAAMNAGGMTIHSFFLMGYAPYIPTEGNYNSNIKSNENRLDLIRSLDVIIIDEVSMVRCDVMDRIDRLLRDVRKINVPFGGVQMVFVGDLLQIAPVVLSYEWDILKEYYDGPFFFSSQAVRNLDYCMVEFSTVYRQRDTDYVKLLSRMRLAKLTSEDYATLNGRFIKDFTPDDSEGYTRLVVNNAEAEKINHSRLTACSGGSASFDAIIEGSFPEEMYPTSKHLVLKKGARVVMIKNASDGTYYNGSLGVVYETSPEKITVVLDGLGEKVELTRAEWSNVEYTIDNKTGEIKPQKRGSFTQYPLKLAWAMTIHKSQGLTLDKVIVDAQRSFANGQAYVAFSRCRTLDGIVLASKVNVRSFKVDDSVLRYYKNIAEKQYAVLDALKRSMSSQTKEAESIVVPLTEKQIKDKLAAWRKDCSMKSGLPAYCILWNDTIDEIARIKPVTVEELACINRIGTTFIDKYGDEVMALITTRISANDSSPVAKVKTQQVSVNMYHSGMDAHEIASQRELTHGTIMNHLIWGIKNGQINREEIICDYDYSLIKNYILAHPECTKISDIWIGLKKEIDFAAIRYVLEEINGN